MGKIKELTFLDTETTGHDVNALTDEIVEVAAARVDLKSRRILDSFEALIRPHGPQIHPGHQWDLGEYHRAQDTFGGVDWTYGLELPLALDILLDRFLRDGTTVSGQNPRFDLGYLRRDVEHLDMVWPKLDYHVPDLCSSALFLVMAGKVESVSLRNLVPWAYADPNRKQRHRAMSDVQDSIRVFFAMYDYFTQGRRPHPDDSLRWYGAGGGGA